MFGKTFSSAHFHAEALLRRAALGVLVLVAAFARVLRHRREVRQLAELDDRALKDMLRSDIAGALDQPWQKDPSRILTLRRLERRLTHSPALGKLPTAAPRIRSR